MMRSRQARRALWRFWLGVAADTSWSLAWERGAAMKDMLRERTAPMKTVLAVAATTVGILLLLGLRVWLYPAVLSAPHGGGSAISSVIGLAILVVVYALVAVVILQRSLQRSGAFVGVAAGDAAWGAGWRLRAGRHCCRYAGGG